MNVDTSTNGINNYHYPQKAIAKTWNLSEPSTFLSPHGMDEADQRFLLELGITEVSMEREFPFFANKINKYDAYNFFNTVNAHQSSNKLHLIKQVFPLLTRTMNKGDAYSLFHAVDKMHPNDVASVLELAPSLFTEEMEALKRIEIMDVLQQILCFDRPDAVEKTKQVITPRMGAAGILALLRTMSRIDRDKRPDVINRATPLFTEEMDGIGRSAILKVVDVVGDEISDIATMAEPLIHPKMTGESRALIYKEVYDIKGEEERKSVIETVSMFMSDNMDGPQVVDIVQTVRRIAIGDRSNAAFHSVPLINDEMDGYGKANVLRDVGTLVREHRKEVIDYARSLYPSGMVGSSDRMAIVKAISTLENRKNAVEWTMRLKPPAINSSGIIDFLKVTSQITDEKVIAWTIIFYPEALKSVSDRLMLLRTVHEISKNGISKQDDWEASLFKARERITDQMSASEVQKILLGDQKSPTTPTQELDLIEQIRMLRISKK